MIIFYCVLCTVSNTLAKDTSKYTIDNVHCYINHDHPTHSNCTMWWCTYNELNDMTMSLYKKISQTPTCSLLFFLNLVLMYLVIENYYTATKKDFTYEYNISLYSKKLPAYSQPSILWAMVKQKFLAYNF